MEQTKELIWDGNLVGAISKVKWIEKALTELALKQVLGEDYGV